MFKNYQTAYQACLADSQMTGSAYQAMDVFVLRDSLYRVGVWGRDGRAIPPDSRLADCLQNLSPKSAKISEKSLFFNDFSNFWRSVLEMFFEIILILLTGSAYQAMDVFGCVR